MLIGRIRFRTLVAASVVAPMALLASAFGDNAPEIVSVTTAGVAGDDASYEASVSNNGKIVVFRSQAQNLTTLAQDDDQLIYLRDRATGTTTMVSEIDEAPFSSGCYNPQVSANGRWVLFQTYHQGIDPPDDSGDSDLYLVDRRSGAMRVVSVNAAGTSGNTDAFMDGASLSANGRYAVIYSTAANFTADPVDGLTDQVYFFDLKKGTVALVSKGIGGAPANGGCGQPSVSANGRWVVFHSGATNLVAGVATGTQQVFAWDSRRRTLRHASPASGGGSADEACRRAVVSNAGVVVFNSEASNLLPVADGDGEDDLFLHDPRNGGTMRRISESEPGVSPTGLAEKAAISQNGRLVVFGTTQSLDSSDDNGLRDIYAYDVPTGTVRLVTRDTDGNASGNGASDLAAHSLSPNGRWLAFVTAATNLATGDGNGVVQDVLVVDPRR